MRWYMQGLFSGIRTMVSALTACAGVSTGRRTIGFVAVRVWNARAPNYHGAAAKAHGRTEKWSAVLQSLCEASRQRANISPGQYISAASACGKGQQWQWALSLLSELAEAKLRASVFSYSAGVSACERGKQWQRALSLLREMREAKLEPNIIFSYNAGISACEKCEQWQRALALMNEMREGLSRACTGLPYGHLGRTSPDGLGVPETPADAESAHCSPTVKVALDGFADEPRQVMQGHVWSVHPSRKVMRE
ncbi:unnamed protein product [Prorocentrum cordatum]|uniref:Pentatricopeptide repeat-containing protein, mitochondrial n=1 Tax=Prorocentrum cordatum TaxID=2364126 RepID=A0ABN9SA45_9DINO|nr:unnamed protein product [Polarella glacialis]